jgi:hypothetical protein
VSTKKPRQTITFVEDIHNLLASTVPLTRPTLKKLRKLQDFHAKRHAKWKLKLTTISNYDDDDDNKAAAVTVITVDKRCFSGSE